MEYIVWMRQNYIYILSTLIFACLGYFGIPVLVPATAHEWVWVVMYNHRFASVCVFAVLGFLVACTIDACMKRRHRAWAYGCFSIILIFSIISSYRTLAGNNEMMWGQVRNGLFRVNNMGLQLQKGSSYDVTQAASLITAAGDIGNASLYFGRQDQSFDMYELASAIYQAGFYMMKKDDPAERHEAEQFIEQCYPIIRNAAMTNRGMLTPSLIKQTTAKLKAIIPKDFNPFWFPY